MLLNQLLCWVGLDSPEKMHMTWRNPFIPLIESVEIWWPVLKWSEVKFCCDNTRLWQDMGSVIRKDYVARFHPLKTPGCIFQRMHGCTANSVYRKTFNAVMHRSESNAKPLVTVIKSNLRLRKSDKPTSIYATSSIHRPTLSLPNSWPFVKPKSAV